MKITLTDTLARSAALGRRVERQAAEIRALRAENAKLDRAYQIAGHAYANERAHVGEPIGDWINSTGRYSGSRSGRHVYGGKLTDNLAQSRVRAADVMTAAYEKQRDEIMMWPPAAPPVTLASLDKRVAALEAWSNSRLPDPWKFGV